MGTDPEEPNKPSSLCDIIDNWYFTNVEMHMGASHVDLFLISRVSGRSVGAPK